MALSAEEQFSRLYRRAWAQQNDFFIDKLAGDWMVPIATPVLAFGRWQTARVATVGINPSRREFLDDRDNVLSRQCRRFLHRHLGDPNAPGNEEITRALELSEGYFELGNALWPWFDGFAGFLEELGSTYRSGLACHTDYLSPFATSSGRKNPLPTRVRRILLEHGLACWANVVALLPSVELIFGMGAGREMAGGALGVDTWASLDEFSDKAFRSYRAPFLFQGRLPHRKVSIFWWVPHFGDPIGGLTADEKRQLGRAIRRHHFDDLT